jgi:hypothetical protein
MSSISLSGNNSGTGSITLQSPNTNSNQVVNIPDVTDTMTTKSTQSMVLISRQVASASASIDFTSISNTTYEYYKLIITNAIPANNAVNLLLQGSVAGTFITSSYTWQNWRWTTAGSGVAGQSAAGSGIALDAAGSDNMANTVGGSWSVDIFNCANSGYKNVNYQGIYMGSTMLGITGNGILNGSSAVDGFRLKMDAGNIASGTFALYGIRNS